MGKFTVIIPTFNHGPTLEYAVGSILKQTHQDFDVYVIGDGAPDITREVMGKLCKLDKRIHYVDKPKGPRNGEIYRDPIIQQVRSDYIAYLSDDDLWLTNHLEILDGALREHDLAHTLHVNVFPDERIMTQIVLLQMQEDVSEMINNDDYGYDLTFGGHRRDYYLKLPYGWRTTPKGINTDTYMWRQFLQQPDCRALSLGAPTGIHFSNVDRRDWSDERRVAELRDWSQRLDNPAQRERFLLNVQQEAVNNTQHFKTMARNEIDSLKARMDELEAAEKKLLQIKNSRWWRLYEKLRGKL
jgi:GalNAc5-diNAcBac-PP-undecaprenol beta-1,3-glucosyltransferase